MTGAPRTLAILAVAGAAALWGTIGLAAAAVPVDVAAAAVGAAGMGVGGLLLFLLAPRQALRVLRRPFARSWVLVGAVGVFVYPLAIYPAMRWSGVAVANVVALGSGPVFAAVIEWATQGRRPSAGWAAGTALAVAGVALLAFDGADAAVGPAPLAGIGLALIAGLAYAVYAVASARAIALGCRSTPTMGAMFGAAGVPLVVVAIVAGAPLWTDPTSLGVIAYLAVGPLAVAYLLFGYGVRFLAPSTATTVSLVEPVVATVLAVLVLHERPGVLGWVGIAGVLAAIVVVGVLDRRRT